MTSLTQRLWIAAGQPMEPLPAVPHESNEACAVCGCICGLALHAKDGIPATDTDLMYYKAPSSRVVCVACRWVSQGQPPDTIRLWSLVYRKDSPLEDPGLFAAYLAGKSTSINALANLSGIIWTNRSQWRSVVHTLCSPPECDWAVCIANSGQIHTVRFGTINHGDHWTVRFERQDVSSNADEFTRLLHRVAQLKSAGFRDAEIASGQPSPASLFRAVQAWHTHATHIDYTRHINSPALDLALFCCTKEYTDEWITYTAHIIASRGDSVGGCQDVAGDIGFLQSRQNRPEEVLGPRPKSAPNRSGQGSDIRANGQRDARPVTDRRGIHGKDQQVSLFDWPDP